MDCMRYICQDLPYEYIDNNQEAHNNYLRFFDNLQKEAKDGKKISALSFHQLIDIINTDYDSEETDYSNEDCAGGYSI